MPKRSSQKMLGVLLPRSYIAAVDRARSGSRYLKTSRSAYIRKIMFDALTAAGQALDGRYINLGYIHGQEECKTNLITFWVHESYSEALERVRNEESRSDYIRRILFEALTTAGEKLVAMGKKFPEDEWFKKPTKAPRSKRKRKQGSHIAFVTPSQEFAIRIADFLLTDSDDGVLLRNIPHEEVYERFDIEPKGRQYLCTISELQIETGLFLYILRLLAEKPSLREPPPATIISFSHTSRS